MLHLNSQLKSLIDKLWDKAVDKWDDWQAAQHIAKKYDDDGYLRKKE